MVRRLWPAHLGSDSGSCRGAGVLDICPRAGRAGWCRAPSSTTRDSLSMAPRSPFSPPAGRAGSSRSRRTSSGEFIQIGLASGPYTLTAEKDKLGSAPANVTVRVGAPAEIKLVLGIAAAGATKEAAAKADGAEEGVRGRCRGQQRRQARRGDRQVQRRALPLSPNCFDCYNNIGYSHTQKKEFDQAEAAYKKSTEIKPDDAAA